MDHTPTSLYNPLSSQHWKKLFSTAKVWISYNGTKNWGTRFDKLGLSLLWQPRQNGTQTCWGRVAHPNLLWLVWPVLANSWLLWRNSSSSFTYMWENGWIPVPVPVPVPHAKMEPGIWFGFQFWKSDPVPVQFWVTQGPELVFDIWLPFS
jgi:hypothetical protein